MINTAVISVGGKGTRLASFTNGQPKPLVRIGEVSVLEYTIGCLSSQGITNILLLSCYKSQSFLAITPSLSQKYKVNIRVFVEDEPLGEAGGLWVIKDKLPDTFLFVNGDIVFDISIPHLLSHHQSCQSLLTVVAHTSTHAHDSDTIQVYSGSRITETSSKSFRTSTNLSHHLGNAGILIVSKTLLYTLPSPSSILNSSAFESLTVRTLARSLPVYAYITSEYIKDMGTPKRLLQVISDIEEGKTERLSYRKKQRALFLDRDNTLIKCSQKCYINSPEDISILSENVARISALSADYDLVCMVTNQPQISFGLLSFSGYASITSSIINKLISHGLLIDIVKTCPHHPHTGFDSEIKSLKTTCFCRKPSPGLLYESFHHFNIDASLSLFIGDSEADSSAAASAGVRFHNICDL